MKKHLIAVSALCASCLMAAAQAQTDPSKPGGTSSQDDPSSATKSYKAKDKDKDPSSTSALSQTGRSGAQEVRATKLMGAQVKGSSGSSIGTINDILLNPASGKVDFAVISLSSSSSDTGTSPTTTRTSPTAPGGPTSSSSEGKLAAVPWNMLRSAPSAGYGATATASSGAEQAFVFAGDQSKLQSGPTFDQSSWPDVSQPSWRQSIYSHFGVSAGSSTGGATTPGGTGTGTSDSSQPDRSTTPPSTTPPKSTSPTTPDSTGSSSKP